MSTRTLSGPAILAAGVGVGFAGDFLLRGPGGPGLNVALLFALLASSVGIVAMNGGLHLSREARAWMVMGVILGTGTMWRGSELLRLLAIASAVGAFALPAFHAGRAWVRKAAVAELLEAGVASGFHAVFGSARLLQKAPWESMRAGDSHPSAAGNAARSAAAGLLLAILPLGVFGALFLSADAMFARILGDFVKIDLASLTSHLLVVAILSWLASGYLTGFSSGTRLDGLRNLGWEFPTLRGGDVAVALGLVDLLFLAFVTVQLRYLFGGSHLVEVTAGLTYAAYAREGFFQLVAATALGLPWLLAAESMLRKAENPAPRIFRVLAGAQLLLLLAIVASALERMRAYLGAYGLTEDRFVATAVLLWLALMVVWFGATVLRGKRERFAFGTVVSGFGLVVLLHLVNPTAYATRSHLDRARDAVHRGPASGPTLDAAYLARLGSDATPILVEHIDGLNEEARCEVADRLLARWGPDREWNWRGWNLADWKARQVVGSAAARLKSMTKGDRGCT